jgi:hypothetical protein
MTRSCESIACIARREPGASIRVSAASVHCCGDVICNSKAPRVRNIRASIASRPTGRTSKSDGETGVPVRIRHSATKCESGALIRAGIASCICGARSGHRHGDEVRTVEARTVRNNHAGAACRPGGGTSKFNSGTSANFRIHRGRSSRLSPSERQEMPNNHDRLMRRVAVATVAVPGTGN